MGQIILTIFNHWKNIRARRAAFGMRRAEMLSGGRTGAGPRAPDGAARSRTSGSGGKGFWKGGAEAGKGGGRAMPPRGPAGRLTSGRGGEGFWGACPFFAWRK